MITPYQFAINNTKQYIQSEENQRNVQLGRPHVTAFDAASILGIAFLKSQPDVLHDLTAS